MFRLLIRNRAYGHTFHSSFLRTSLFACSRFNMSSLLVYGGSGQLGDAIINHFKNNGFTTTISVDFRQSNTATSSIVLSGEVHSDIDRIAEALLNSHLQLDAVICAAGGWLGGDIRSKDIFINIEKMHKFNMESAVTCSHLASHFLKDNGLLVLTGAAAAVGPTPSMIAYGMTKAATHHLIESLAVHGLPKGATVAGNFILNKFGFFFRVNLI